jgi:hypothetical protein
LVETTFLVVHRDLHKERTSSTMICTFSRIIPTIRWFIAGSIFFGFAVFQGRHEARLVKN